MKQKLAALLTVPFVVTFLCWTATVASPQQQNCSSLGTIAAKSPGVLTLSGGTPVGVGTNSLSVIATWAIGDSISFCGNIPPSQFSPQPLYPHIILNSTKGVSVAGVIGPTPISTSTQTTTISQHQGCSALGTIAVKTVGGFILTDGRSVGFGTSSISTVRGWDFGDSISFCGKVLPTQNDPQPLYPDVIRNTTKGVTVVGKLGSAASLPAAAPIIPIFAAPETTSPLTFTNPISITESSNSGSTPTTPTQTASTNLPTTTQTTTSAVPATSTSQKPPLTTTSSPQTTTTPTATTILLPGEKGALLTEYCVVASPGSVQLKRVTNTSAKKNVIVTLYNGDCGVLIATVQPATKGTFVRASVKSRSGWIIQKWLVRR